MSKLCQILDVPHVSKYCHTVQTVVGQTKWPLVGN